MDAVDLRTIADAVGGELRGDADGITGVQIDSRRCGPGDVFVALPGERVDGHGFVPGLEGRAAAALVESWLDTPLPQCRVLSGRGALAALGRWNRARCEPAVVGITGSNGKTTVKAILSAMLETAGPTLATAGNFNNELGVPLTLCRLEGRHAYAVVEMGASGPGEIAKLAAMARPRVGLVTNVAAAHLKGFGSLAGVAAAKGELYAALPPDGVAVVNAGDPYAERWRELIGRRQVITFGADDQAADVVVRATADGVAVDLAGRRITAAFELLGAHNRRNAAAAAAAALALGAPTHAIAAGLAAARAVPGRLALRRTASGGRLIDDSYNANPDSLAAALDVLAELDGERWLVLGDMAELGERAQALHREAGERARDRGVSRLFAFGPLARAAGEAFGGAAEWFDDQAALIERLRGLDRADAVMLVKGSRSAAMARVAAALAPVARPDDKGAR